MSKICSQEILSCFENTFEVLFSLETIIKVTQNNCLDKEVCAKYYNLPAKEQCILSEERNQYINMLTLAMDKVSRLKEINLVIEQELSRLQ